MADDTYLFIDGNYLREKHSKAIRRVFTQVPEISLPQLKGQANAKRVFSMTASTTLETKRRSRKPFRRD